MVDTVGCNVAGWEVADLGPNHTLPSHRAKWAVVAQQQSNKEEGAHSVRKNRKDKERLINSERS